MRGPIAPKPAAIVKVAALAVAASAVGLTMAARSLADVAGAASPRGGAALVWEDQRLTGIDGEPFDAAALAGRVVLLVNTASRCAFTPQYEGLEALNAAYRGLGLTVLAVPSNDFGGQEPGSDADIANFCTSRYKVSFPMLQKAPVTGSGAHPLFAWARRAGGRAAVPGWNFHKILIGRDGRIAGTFASYVSPRSPQVMGAVEAALRTTGF
ncbi:glutathione peroxidase [Acuticoccus yangtzensis]|uniref:glutathione peroxidase n=1 Tax=Acuticoccus yangtzensis TaxID=1443441 RepID=UPI000ACE353C|nr:glutathione peroxidase [Acuticoccus yangtzensis]